MTHNNKSSQGHMSLKSKQRKRHAQIRTSWPQYSVAETLVAVICNQLSNIPYIFRLCDLLVQSKSHEKKLKMKNDPFTDCHTEGITMKAKLAVTNFFYLFLKKVHK